MKKPFILILNLFVLGCTTTNSYSPTTYFPDGPIVIEASINHEFSDSHNRFVEVLFYNDNREWVEIESLTIDCISSTPCIELRENNQIDIWLRQKENEIVSKTGGLSDVAGLLSSLGSLASTLNNDPYLADELLIDAERHSYEADSQRDRARHQFRKIIENGTIGATVDLPPGRKIARWLVFHTPEGLPSGNLKIDFVAAGKVSGKRIRSDVNLPL